MTREALGERLATARQGGGYSQEEAAKDLGISRSIIAQIETGRRDVTSAELASFARLYRRDVMELLTETSLTEDTFLVIGRIEGGDALLKTEPVVRALYLMREAKKLEGFLGQTLQTSPPVYAFEDPRTPIEAVEQGKEVAQLERRRLDLGSAPIPDIAKLLEQQSVWAVAADLPVNISGLFVKDPKYGTAIFINQAHQRERRRFSYAHEYAHALLDQNRPATPTSIENEKDTRETRANAFAAEFLVPEAGLVEHLSRMNKGGRSRTNAVLYSVANDNAMPEAKRRNDSVAQKITSYDVALIAVEYEVSYEVVTYRLRNINAITATEMQELLSQRDDGVKLIEQFDRVQSIDKDTSSKNVQPYLSRYLLTLAVEGYRREKITEGRLREICGKVHFPFEAIIGIAQISK